MKLAKKRKLVRPKIKLGLLDLEQSKAAVVGSLTSPGSKREYHTQQSCIYLVVAAPIGSRSRRHESEHYYTCKKCGQAVDKRI